jgi:hypothetical protein
MKFPDARRSGWGKTNKETKKLQHHWVSESESIQDNAHENVKEAENVNYSPSGDSDNLILNQIYAEKRCTLFRIEIR